MAIPVCLGLSLLELGQVFMYEFWCDYVKVNYGEQPILCYMDRDSFIVYIETGYIYIDIAEDVKTRLDTSN